MELDEFRGSLDDWLDQNEHLLKAEDAAAAAATLDEQMAQLAKVKRLTYDAGFMRWGWPERVGGLGGSSLLRAYLGEALTFRGLVEPGIYSMTEVLAPTMIDYAAPELAATMVPRLLRGDETWCQGFSEPGTGSNLASLTCRATRTDDGWRVSGQKVWTSLAQYAQRCVLLTRTGEPDSAHRGITALFVDMDSPGVEVRPIETMHGAPEFSEVFFDDVAVPVGRTLGAEGQGWSVAMDLLPYERSTALWHRAAYLQRRLQALLQVAPAGELDAADVGAVAQLLFALRARSRATQRRLAAGERLGPETSIDKVLVATAEQAIFDLAADGLAQRIATGDDPASERWRREYLYSRAATIYGGTAEIQRNIIARRLLDLGADR
jgi:alkylation response protein AidB-like acyl-CoA dehydrogenase